MFNWLLDIVSGSNNSSGGVSIFDNLINIYQENPQEFWIRILAFIGAITIFSLPYRIFFKLVKNSDKDRKNNKETKSD